ncbi:GNAT family N-acetyltransferase [Demequina sp. SYSU T00192]|uniref:GNAT family N-acetyltransferase n=1 Tax=Demequina litoralis TaxID=3051660 RepID=A0ABT8GAQ2_9MICO|nr:GNAT family N-acetyltransferase [Demequina sp. SYSU T00192]MDN4476047.1 GNAT family N-acetyltransferase [Demequina sp. SYSU T00192]
MTAPVEIDLDAGPDEAGPAIDAMHRAFAEYSLKGQPSGALTETAETLRDEMRAGIRIALARVAGEVVAVAKYHDADDGSLYFGRLGVVPEARGAGLAAALVRALRDDARARGRSGLSCLVRAEEHGNIAVYQALGMEVTARGERVSRTGALLQVVEMRDVEAAAD